MLRKSIVIYYFIMILLYALSIIPACVLLGTIGYRIPYVSIGNYGYELLMRSSSYIVITLLLLLGRLILYRFYGKPSSILLCVFYGILTAGFTILFLSQYITALRYGVSIDIGEAIGLKRGEAYVNNVKISDEVYSVFDGEQRLRIYEPKQMRDEKRPILLYIHGGGFISGDRNMWENQLAHFANDNYWVISMDYSLATKDKPTWNIVPQQIEEAVLWINEHVEVYHADVKRFYMIGDSAGAGLALNAANVLNQNQIKTDEGISKVNAVFALCPGIDPFQMYDSEYLPIYKNIVYPMVESYLGEQLRLGKDSIALKTVSAFESITKASPPTYMLSGDHDHIVSNQLVKRYYQALCDAGVEADYKTLPFADHAANTIYRDSIGNQMLYSLSKRWFELHP